MKVELYFWYCPKCGIKEQFATSLQDGKEKLEAHELEVHEGKPVGTFGKKLVSESTNEDYEREMYDWQFCQ